MIFKSIVMRCDRINKEAYKNIPSNIECIYYKDSMDVIWANIQKSAGEFKNKSMKEVLEYFNSSFSKENKRLKKCVFFLKDKNTNDYIATAMAWHSYKQEQDIPIVHWVAVDEKYSGKGYARIVITQVLKIFEKEYPKQSIYLHTQPSSYKAIKLYNDFGFNMTKKDTYKNIINEYDEAMEVLQKYMTKESYEKLKNSSVL